MQTPTRFLTAVCLVSKVFTDMPGGKQGDQDEVVITGDALIKRCPQQDGRRGDVIEPDYGGRMQVCSAYTRHHSMLFTCIYICGSSAESARIVSSPHTGC